MSKEIEALEIAKKFITELVSFGGEYPKAAGTNIVPDAYTALRGIEQALNPKPTWIKNTGVTPNCKMVLAKIPNNQIRYDKPEALNWTALQPSAPMEYIVIEYMIVE